MERAGVYCATRERERGSHGVDNVLLTMAMYRGELSVGMEG